MISKTGIHALLALGYLAKLPAGIFGGTAEIAREIGAPRNYLGKLLQNLSSVGLVHSQKGHGGGFRLARAPEKITLFHVLEPIDHVSRWQLCFLGQDRCSERAPCPLHERWGRVRGVFVSFLRETTIADIAGKPELLEEPKD
jgi:Rrf2 family transcriptional regulator, iron-sulfur cluster assembly transcription factor